MTYHFESLPLLFAAGLLLSLIFTGFAQGIGRRIGLVDQPDGRRKIHARVVPLVGGIAVFASTVIVLVVAFVAPGPFSEPAEADVRELLGLLIGSAVICAVGVIDDYRHLRGRYKLLGQAVAVAIVMASGIHVKIVTLFGWDLDLGWLAIPFTVFWLLGAINSLNLLDGMDGLLGTVGTIVCLAFAVMAAMYDHFVGACVATALAGALVGFLRYNYPPASVFLGDAGSMLVGLVIGVLAIRCCLKGPATVALAAPAALLILPILDTAAAVVRRKLTGRSIFTTDRGHLHHCLLRGGLSRPRILLLVSGLCSLTVLGALGSIAYRSEGLAVLSAAAVAFILMITGLFGCAEVVLLAKSLRDYAGSVIGTPRTGREIEVRLQGSAQWGDFWKRLTGSADRLKLRSISMDVNSPAHHEGYHARWCRPSVKFGEEPNCWSAVILLTAWGQTIGQVAVTGHPDVEPVWQKLAELTAITDGIEAVLSGRETSGVVEPLVGTAST
jgi:UDP-GlcNAc:undecaprenyl-phosphate/decaprenyl-phosphate GlcNAc-1-phosphate transferase